MHRGTESSQKQSRPSISRNQEGLGKIYDAMVDVPAQTNSLKAFSGRILERDIAAGSRMKIAQFLESIEGLL
jgi:hypothetical protein